MVKLDCHLTLESNEASRCWSSCVLTACSVDEEKRGCLYGKLLAPCQDAISEERLLGKENRETWVGSLKGSE